MQDPGIRILGLFGSEVREQHTGAQLVHRRPHPGFGLSCGDGPQSALEGKPSGLAAGRSKTMTFSTTTIGASVRGLDFGLGL